MSMSHDKGLRRSITGKLAWSQLLVDFHSLTSLIDVFQELNRRAVTKNKRHANSS